MAALLLLILGKYACCDDCKAVFLQISAAIGFVISFVLHRLFPLTEGSEAEQWKVGTLHYLQFLKPPL